MSEIEDPIHFSLKKTVGDIQIEYSNLMEITQGGPQIGNLSINRRVINGRYGGPLLFQGMYIYVPMYVQKFLGAGFKLSRINTSDLKVEPLGKVKDLIFLDKIEGDRIFFFEDIGKNVHNYITLS